MKRLFEKYQSDLSGLFWLALGVFLTASLISYHPTDPSLNSIVQSGRPQNLCGYLGSFLADLLYQGFGFSAWILVLGSIRQAFICFRGKVSRKDRPQWWLDGLLLVCVTCLLSLHLGDVRFYSGQIRVGGWVGHAMTLGLVKAMGKVGIAILLWTFFAALMVFYTDRTWSELVQRPRETVTDLLAAWWGAFLAGMNFLLRPVIQRPALATGSKAAAPMAATATQAFFKIQPEEKQTRVEQVDDESEMEEGNESEEHEDDRTPLTGFLTEQLQTKLFKRPKKAAPVKIPRRVENWELPKLSLLEDPPSTRARLDEREIKGKARLLVEKLAQFSVRGEVVGIKPGPAVTMFEFKPAADVKISKITDLADDLSLALSSESVRIVAPIPGRDVVGIETSNSVRESVFVKDIVSQENFWDDETKLPIPLGRKADGEPRIVDLRKMPHLLVAGTTGSGKSVFIVSMITGLLFRHSPKTLKLILVDPKQVDLAAFNDIPHLIMPPIREAKKAVGALRWGIREMEKRYRSMAQFGARGLEAYNEIVSEFDSQKVQEHAAVNGALEGSFHPESYYYQPLPYIVIVVEEFGDLMAVDKINVEQAVVRLAQMARACGIHLVLAMQSPRKDVVTGLIKTNIPGRISFKVASKMDSRIILDEGGAERLLARGDMLFLAPGVSKPERHHGPYLSEEEISQVCHTWKIQGEPEYDAIAMKVIDGSGGGFDTDGGGPAGDGGGFGGFDGEIKDDRYDEVLSWVASQREVSASLLQRKFRLGYPRAARMIEIFEAEGVVGPANGSKPRQVLVREMPK
ncbi:MAG TPA: DNA translocase FtsK 4TM domain-containing protein [Bdellovibrionales bacterium]|nr:DNA translocase FtsK 4TM domain-containing protein [Bdellovibrionales bacterium]